MDAETKVSLMLWVLTEAAQGAGLPEERAEAVYMEVAAELRPFSRSK